MKDTILVNLVSDQTIPNVQFVKWYFNQNHLPMKLFLLSTKEMENKQTIFTNIYFINILI